METLLSQYIETRRKTEELCAPLHAADYVAQLEAFASPPKWHLAHTTWFFEEMILKENCADYPLFHPHFGYLFNSYYNAVGKRVARAQRGGMTRPDIDAIYAYRKHVDRYLSQLLSTPVSRAVAERITLGIHHEQQHQELLLTDLKYTLGRNPIYPVYHPDFSRVADGNEAAGWLEIPEGIYEIGCDSTGFCFDNERARHKVYLQDYSISKALVTNGEFMEFIAAGGYEKYPYWLDEGWAWVRNSGAKSPLYWHEIDGQWHVYTLAGLRPMDHRALLAHISFYEASAFALWKGCRLPTEFEWEAASGRLQWGLRWEWTNSAYLPYPGFKAAPGALGEYNGKFMINQMVLRGSSAVTPKGHSRHTYRNFFHPHFQWQYAGIRLVK